jgi:hypothetical protein
VAQRAIVDERALVKALQGEATWLQKALFALNKVQAAREAQAEAKETTKVEPFVIKVGRSNVKLTDLIEAMDEHAKAVLEDVSERRMSIR